MRQQVAVVARAVVLALALIAGAGEERRSFAAEPEPPTPGAVPVVVPRDEPPRPRGPVDGKSLLTLPKQRNEAADTVFWLQPDVKNGGYTWKGAGFRARISKDGELSFDDKHVTFKITPVFLPRPNPYSVPSLQSQILGRPAPQRALSDIVPRPEEIFTGYVSPYHADTREAARVGREKLDYGSNVPIVMVSAGFDLTDELMRLNGQDPYRYEKARFAASTRPFREKLAARARNQNLREACQRMRESLSQLATNPPPPPATVNEAVRALEANIDGSTAEGRALLGFLAGVRKDGRAIPASVHEPLSDDEPRLCGLVAMPPVVAPTPSVAPASKPAP